MKSAATPATAHLAKHGVEYTEHEFEYKEHGGTGHSSAQMGVPEHAVIKTLVMEDDKGQPLIVLMHGDRKVSTKELARQARAKRVAPLRLPHRRHLALRHPQAHADLSRALGAGLAAHLHQRRKARLPAGHAAFGSRAGALARAC
jgi:hypothetical protein